jgi:hypothetical protein
LRQPPPIVQSVLSPLPSRTVSASVGPAALTYIKVPFFMRNHLLGMGNQERALGRGNSLPHLSNTLRSIAVSGTGDLDLETISPQLGRRPIGRANSSDLSSVALPVPLGHVVPGAAISVLAMGVIERDGLAIAAGLVVALIGLIIVVFASAGLVAVLRTWLPII